jgi:hypothetical protein
LDPRVGTKEGGFHLSFIPFRQGLPKLFLLRA